MRIVSMPEGHVVGQVATPNLLVGSMHPASGVGFFPVSTEEHDGRWRTVIERIDLRTSQTTLRIDAGSVLARRGARAPSGDDSVLGDAASTADGALVLLGRVVVASGGPAVRIDAFDGRSGALLRTSQRVVDTSGSVTRTIDPGVRLVNVDEQNFVLVHEFLDQGHLMTQDLAIVDRDLNERGRVTRDAGALQCGPELARSAPANAWVTLCWDWSRAAGSYAQLLERDTFAALGRVEFPRELGIPLAWRVADDGILVVLTDRPAVIRIDTRSRTIVDKRLISAGLSLPFELFPVALAKVSITPQVQLTLDGRFAYVTSSGEISGWGPLSLIDLVSGKVIARGLEGDDVRGIRLSADGARLYALVAEGPERTDTRLLLLDPRSLAALSRSGVLPRSPSAILAVAPRD